MKKILALCLLTFGYFLSYAQVANVNHSTGAIVASIRSFEGNKEVIKLTYKPASGKLTISHLSDTIIIDDYFSIDTVRVLNNVFLQVNYVKRVGSNQDAINQLLLYVYKGKLSQALHLNVLRRYAMRPDEYSFFNLKTSLSGADMNTYKLKFDLYIEKNNKLKPESNLKSKKAGFLSFDAKEKVFYDSKENIIGLYRFHDLKTKNGLKKNLKNYLPVIKIENDKYYYFSGDWYSKEGKNFYSMTL